MNPMDLDPVRRMQESAEHQSDMALLAEYVETDQFGRIRWVATQLEDGITELRPEQVVPDPEWVTVVKERVAARCKAAYEQAGRERQGRIDEWRRAVASRRVAPRELRKDGWRPARGWSWVEWFRGSAS